MDAQDMQVLLEIKNEVRKLNALSDGIEDNVKTLNAHTDELKKELDDVFNANTQGMVKTTKRLLKPHLYRALMYQEVIKKPDGEILSYGDIYMQGYSLNNTGANRASMSEFSRVALPSDVEFIDVFGGHTTFYALPKEGNSLYVWGANPQGCAGVGHTNAILLPTKIDFPARVKKVVCGTSESNTNQSAIALLENGLVYVAGSNTIGELGVGNTLPISTFTPNPHLSNIKDVFLASNGTAGIFLSIDHEGSLYTCGHNAQGACGDGKNANLSIPYKLTFAQKVKLAKASINSTYATSLILFEDGSVRGAGYALDNNLSQSSIANSNIFINLIDAQGNPLEHIIDIFPASINGTSFALTQEGNLYAWGKGSYGYGGVNTQANMIAHKVLENVESIAHWDRANTRVVAKLKNNALLAFGFNTDGSLGIGTTLNTTAWSSVLAPSNVSDYTLFCFGSEGHLSVIAQDELWACGTPKDGSIKYTTPTLQKQTNC